VLLLDLFDINGFSKKMKNKVETIITAETRIAVYWINVFGKELS
jgi:hypothetical protein